MTFHDLLSEIEKLSNEKKIQLLEFTILQLRGVCIREEAPAEITDLDGLGKEIWSKIDVDRYLREMRESWES